MSSVTWGLGPYVSESRCCHNHFSQFAKNSAHPTPSRKKQVFPGQKDSLSSPCSSRPFRHTPHRGVTPSEPTGRVRYQHPGSDPCHKPECSQEEFSLKATQSHLQMSDCPDPPPSAKNSLECHFTSINRTMRTFPSECSTMPTQSSTSTATHAGLQPDIHLLRRQRETPFKLLLPNKNPRLICCVHQYNSPVRKAIRAHFRRVQHLSPMSRTLYL